MECGCQRDPRSGPRTSDATPIFLGASRGLCRECGNHELREVRYVSDGERVYLERRCPTHGRSLALVAESLAWFLEVTRERQLGRPPERVLAPRCGECPTACGPCELHAQRCTLPVLSITNACNLGCPICFTYNRADRTYFMSAEELDRHLDLVVEATGGVDLVNITGGEPTLHPELLTLLARARRPGIGRVTVNTNGIRIAEDPELARGLAEVGAYAVLSLDTLDPERSQAIHGRDLVALKRRALENLERAGVQTTLLMVLVGGVNEDELGAMVELLLGRDHLRSLTIQTMTYTGQGGSRFAPRLHLPVDGVARRIERATGGRLRAAAFQPLPTAHPLCYAVSYLLCAPGGGVHALADLLGRECLARHLAEGYLLRPTESLERELRDAIDRLWSEGKHPELLAAVKAMLVELYPTGTRISVHERQRRAERQVKTIYLHAHMDEETYELGRAMRCPDQVPVHAERLIGACNYNLFHRMHDPRFWIEEARR